MIHPVRMMTNISKNDRFVCHAVKQIRSRTVWPHILCGNEARSLNNIELRMFLNELLYRSKMFL